MKGEWERLIESIFPPLESFVRSNICWDENSPYYGGLLETIPLTPNPAWSHSSYQVADAYLRLYEAYSNEKYWRTARAIVNFLVREQTDAGCWYGYAGYPKSAGWNEKNAPPGSKLNVKLDEGTVLDIIRSPFSIFGTALYSKVIANAIIVAEARGKKIKDLEKWHEAFINAAEFIRCMIDDRGYWVGGRAWNQRAAVAVTLFTASKMLGSERYLKKAKIILDQVLKAQLPSGEFPYDEKGGRTYHYHCLTISLLHQIYEIYPDSSISKAIIKGLNWLWSMQRDNGDFDWSIHSPKDHKTGLLSTFALALLASAPYLRLYEEPILKLLHFLATKQNRDGGFPRKSNFKNSDTVTSGYVLLALAELIKRTMHH